MNDKDTALKALLAFIVFSIIFGVLAYGHYNCDGKYVRTIFSFSCIKVNE